jgi:hypothetical protein
VNVWLDDQRPMPPGYCLHVKTAEKAIRLLQLGMVTSISLDHDLGEEALYGTGYDVAREIERLAYTGKLKRITVRVHTQNPVGERRIRLALQSAERSWRVDE